MTQTYTIKDLQIVREETKQAMIQIIKDYPNYMIRKSDLLQKLGELKT